MNKERRKRIAELLSEIEVCKDSLESIRDEEQEYYDNMPESFQQSEKGSAAESAIEELEAAGSALDDCISAISNIE